MEEQRRQLTIRERTEIDISIAQQIIQAREKKNKVFRQCEGCGKCLELDNIYCKEYKQGELPKYIMFSQKECEKFIPYKEVLLDGCNEKIFGGLLGHCVGDMLGVPVEFSSRKERENDPVNEMRANGTYSQPFGTWSDDTSLSLCLIDAIGKGGDYKTIADNFIAYMERGKFTPGDELFDIGRTTQLSIERMKQGVSPIECGMKSENDNGNGSLMRILPLAFLKDKYSDGQMKEYVKNVSSLTHGHIRSIIACEFYVEMAYQLYKGASKEESYNAAVRYVLDEYGHIFPEEIAIYSRILKENISDYSKSEIKSSGYVVDSLEASLWAFLNGKSFEDVVFAAINLGGDTDTIGAIAGGLAGMYYGLSSIPYRWIQSIRRLDLIKAEILRFIEKIN